MEDTIDSPAAIANETPETPAAPAEPGPEDPPAPAEQAAPPAPLPPQPQMDFTECPPTLGPKALPPGLSITMSVPKNVYTMGEPIELTLRLVNNGPQPVTRRWQRDQQDYDLWMINTDGKTMWRWTYGDTFTGGAGNVTYEPGDSREVKETWDREVCSGDGRVRYARFRLGHYAFRGYFADQEGAWYSNEVKVEIR